MSFNYLVKIFNMVHVSMYIYIFIIKEQLQEAALKGTVSVGRQEKRKDRKSGKSRSEEKVVGFS